MRNLLPWEKSYLRRFGFDPAVVAAEIGEMPVEYFTGSAEWGDLILEVNADVLIPREETWELVSHIQQDFARRPAPARVADVGTGSGALAIALARAYASAHVVAGDISAAALGVAATNLAQYELQSRISLIQSDLFERFTGEFDLIVANLPYIPTARMQKLSPSVREFEPHLALDGGESGLELVKKLLGQILPLRSSQHAGQSGSAPARVFETIIWLEVDDTHQPEMLGELQHDFSIQVFPDQFGVGRFWRIKLSAVDIQT